MIPISVVLITKNEAAILSQSIPLLKQISDDIIIIDNDSTDGTIAIAKAYGCRVYQKNWSGYGANKNKGIQLARYDWILSVDGDEVPDATLIKSLQSFDNKDDNQVYDIAFKPYLGDKLIRFGNWGRDHHIRLFNRALVRWTETPVHETLILPQQVTVKKITGHLHHYSARNKQELETKIIHYAKLSAVKYLENGKNANFIKMKLAPVFHFIKSYIFLLGFLDGRAGFIIATMAFKNTWLKYHYLSKATQSVKNKQVYQHDLPVMVYKFNADAQVE